MTTTEEEIHAALDHIDKGLERAQAMHRLLEDCLAEALPWCPRSIIDRIRQRLEAGAANTGAADSAIREQLRPVRLAIVTSGHSDEEG